MPDLGLSGARPKVYVKQLCLVETCQEEAQGAIDAGSVEAAQSWLHAVEIAVRVVAALEALDA